MLPLFNIRDAVSVVPLNSNHTSPFRQEQTDLRNDLELLCAAAAGSVALSGTGQPGPIPADVTGGSVRAAGGGRGAEHAVQLCQRRVLV